MSERSSSATWALPVLGPIAADVVGMALIAISWYGASGNVRVSDQLPWVILAVVGLTIAGLGNTGFVIVGRRRLRERQWGIVGGDEMVASPPASATRRHEIPVSAPVMTRYHRPQCQLVVGKPVQPADVETHRRAGRRPCGICHP